MALHSAIKGKLISVIGDEVSSDHFVKNCEFIFNIFVFVSGHLRWFLARWSW